MIDNLSHFYSAQPECLTAGLDITASRRVELVEVYDEKSSYIICSNSDVVSFLCCYEDKRNLCCR